MMERVSKDCGVSAGDDRVYDTTAPKKSPAVTFTSSEVEYLCALAAA
jgi:hypothetical protein